MQSQSKGSAPTDTIVADIGGTNARFARLDAQGRPATSVTVAVAEHDGPASALEAALAALPGPRPRRAALAIAAPITGDAIAFTNAGWRFSVQATQRALGLERLLVLNDFTALAWSLPALSAAQTRPIGGGTAVPGMPLAVIGPGTGLGVSGLVPHGDGWVAISGEGGHASLSPTDPREAAILAEVWRHHSHVSFERLVSGSGLPLLRSAVAVVDGFASPTAMAPDASAITAAAERGDPLANRTLDTFCALLGVAAGNLALTLGARGGVFIGGGIAPRLGERLGQSAFRDRFEAKGRFAGYLAAIPTAVITAREPALIGAAHALGATA